MFQLKTSFNPVFCLFSFKVLFEQRTHTGDMDLFKRVHEEGLSLRLSSVLATLSLLSGGYFCAFQL